MELALREPMPVSAGADNIRHPYSGVWDSFFDSPEFRCASLRAILLCTSGAFPETKQIRDPALQGQNVLSPRSREFRRLVQE